ncbi:hypothetical protein N7456_001930 [Penicillium angulare]|uniref:Uncharacterized protein n=1 Tax=Penicillium angulare TaxID=116970 RepID=A0A9W9G780_9EURO|nr:hypothetical protein N7456_001930 [Penicillium angulare]
MTSTVIPDLVCKTDTQRSKLELTLFWGDENDASEDSGSGQESLSSPGRLDQESSKAERTFFFAAPT